MCSRKHTRRARGVLASGETQSLKARTRARAEIPFPSSALFFFPSLAYVYIHTLYYSCGQEARYRIIKNTERGKFDGDK